MLTDIQIKKYIKSARIRITPFDEKLVKTSSYQIRLGNTLLIPENGQLIDLKNPDEQPRYKKVELTEEGYILKPKEFILGQTLEKIAMDSDILIFCRRQIDSCKIRNFNTSIFNVSFTRSG